MIGRTLTAAMLLFLSAQAATAVANNKLYPDAATIPQTRQFNFTSAIDGEPFTIQVWLPQSKPPKEGYDIIYILDGELYFPFAQFYSNALPGVSPMVVGIGHDALSDESVIARYTKLPTGGASKITTEEANDAFSHLRVLDFTTTLLPENRPPSWLDGSGSNDGGNVDQFLRVIETEIKPRIEAMAPINKNDQAIFGHSLGGLAVVRALFTEPNSFHTFIASSPALYWNRNEVLTGEEAFGRRVRAGQVTPRVLITAAANEDEVPISPDYVKSLTPARQIEIKSFMDKIRSWNGMKSGSIALGHRLKAISGKGAYQAKVELIPDVDHGNEPRVSVWDGLNFAFRDH